MTLRIYLRRSRAEEGKQEFSLDVQRQGCAAFATRLSALLGARLGKPVEYVDDGIAGDDFVGRAGLARLMADAKKGDVILARDQSRIGRNALEVTLAITQLTQDKSTRVFYYSDGGEARCDNVISQTMTFIRGVGGQMELEALRSRTREGLRARVHAGFIAGGRCFGYRNIRESDASGRARTRMEVEPIEADVVRTEAPWQRADQQERRVELAYAEQDAAFRGIAIDVEEPRDVFAAARRGREGRRHLRSGAFDRGRRTPGRRQ